MPPQPHRFAGKVVLVTGAGHGIGRAIAAGFAKEGAYVFINDVNSDRANEAVAAIGPNAIAAPADVSSKPAVDSLFAAILARHSTLDVLVNNAGLINTSRHFLDADEAWWDRIHAVNLKGAFLCSHAAAQIMVPRRSGVILTMSSGGATRAHRGNVAYDATKGGIEAMTRAMALDLAPYGVRVNCLVPGFIRTYDLTDEQAADATRAQSVPLGRMGMPEDLAGPALFLASDDASYLTGVCLPVDGGVLIQQRSAPVDTFPLSRFPTIPKIEPA